LLIRAGIKIAKSAAFAIQTPFPPSTVFVNGTSIGMLQHIFHRMIGCSDPAQFTTILKVDLP